MNKPKDIEITLTIAEIFDLAKFVQIVPHSAKFEDVMLSDEESDTEYTIFKREGGMSIKDDDGIIKKYVHCAYLTEYPDEGTYPLGKEIEKHH